MQRSGSKRTRRGKHSRSELSLPFRNPGERGCSSPVTCRTGDEYPPLAGSTNGFRQSNFPPFSRDPGRLFMKRSTPPMSPAARRPARRPPGSLARPSPSASSRRSGPRPLRQGLGCSPWGVKCLAGRAVKRSGPQPAISTTGAALVPRRALVVAVGSAAGRAPVPLISPLL
jgi:hypothetical protein